MAGMKVYDFDTEKLIGITEADAETVRIAVKKYDGVLAKAAKPGCTRSLTAHGGAIEIFAKPAAAARLFGWTRNVMAKPAAVASNDPADDVQSDVAEGAMGIGSLHMTAATEREAPQPVRGETMVCPCCHRTFERRMRMTTARGSVCPDCYDKWSE